MKLKNEGFVLIVISSSQEMEINLYITGVLSRNNTIYC